jgi:uncharacterized protein (TIGR03437 family)
MRATVLLLWAACALPAQSPPPSNPGPLYVESSIVNAASAKAPVLAPNTLATLWGTNLALVTRGLTGEDLRGGILPTVLGGTGVRIIIGGIPASLFYVSPQQVNFLVPPNLTPGRIDVRLVLDARNGPTVWVTLAEVSPALFQADPEFAVVTRDGGAVVSPKSPAVASEIVTLWATGLGKTRPATIPGEVPAGAARLERLSAFQVTVGGVQIPPEDVLYAGAAPGLAGVYQINVRLPATLDRNPEVRIGFGEEVSPAGVRIPADGK